MTHYDALSYGPLKREKGQEKIDGHMGKSVTCVMRHWGWRWLKARGRLRKAATRRGQS